MSISSAAFVVKAQGASASYISANFPAPCASYNLSPNIAGKILSINDGIGVFLIQRIAAFPIKHFVPPFRSEWVKRSERRAAGSGSLRRRSAGNDKKRPHRHKSLHGRFGAVQHGNCRRLSEGIGILRCPGIARLCSRRGSSPQH